VLGRVVRRLADEWLRVDHEPRLAPVLKDVPGVQVGGGLVIVVVHVRQ
jgi:hypothetical protein